MVETERGGEVIFEEEEMIKTKCFFFFGKNLKMKKFTEFRNYKGCLWCGKVVQTLPKFIIIIFRIT